MTDPGLISRLFPPLCTCDHARLQHVPGGRCLGTDSYSVDCACPGYEPDEEPDDETDQDTLDSEYITELNERAQRAAKRPLPWNRNEE